MAKTKSMNKISLAIAAILVMSIFAFGFVIAEDLSAMNESNSEDLPENERENVKLLIDDANRSLSGYKIIGFTTATYGQGWITSGDDQGVLVNALWVTQNAANVSKIDIKSIKQNYRGNPQGAKTALQDAAEEGFIERSMGYLRIGVGTNTEVLRLERTSMDNSSMSFDVYPFNGKNSSKIGTLTLTGEKLSEMSLWHGTLTLNSGKRVGTFNVEIGAKAQVVKNLGQLNKMERESDKLPQKVEAKGLRGFFNKMKFWKSPKAQADNSSESE